MLQGLLAREVIPSLIPKKFWVQIWLTSHPWLDNESLALSQSNSSDCLTQKLSDQAESKPFLKSSRIFIFMNFHNSNDEKFDPENIYPVPEGIVNKDFFREKIKCPFCGIIGSRWRILDHEEICPKAIVPCVNYHYGCDQQIVRDQMINHITVCPGKILPLLLQILAIEAT